MNTNELNDLSQKLYYHARSQAVAWLEGEAAIGGTVDDEIVEFLARQDVPWERLTVEQQDGLRDHFLESWKLTCSERLAKSDSAASPVSSGEVVVVEVGLMKEVVGALQVVEELHGHLYASERLVNQWSVTRKKCYAALSRLRSLLLQPPLGGPEGVRPLQGASLSRGTDVPPLGDVEKDGEGRETILFEDSDGDGVRITASTLKELWVDSDGFFSLRASSVESLIPHLNQWLDTGSFELSPTVPVQLPVGGDGS